MQAATFSVESMDFTYRANAESDRVDQAANTNGEQPVRPTAAKQGGPSRRTTRTGLLFAKQSACVAKPMPP